MKKSIRDVSIDSKILYQKLSEMKPGEAITYAELTRLIGRDVQKQARGFLQTAREMCQRENKLVFGAVINEGLKCLEDNEVIDSAMHSIGHIKRASFKSIKKMSCINNITGMTKDDKIRFDTAATVLGVMAAMTKSSEIKKIENRVKNTQEQLPYAIALDVFK